MGRLRKVSLEGKSIGIGFTGSFCTFDKIEIEVRRIAELGARIYPIFSFAVQSVYSRFGDTGEYMERICQIAGRRPILTIDEAEPIGPKGYLDVMLIAPCTGNTLAKLSAGITDTPVLMAAKAHMRGNKPVVISLSTNDALGMNFKNIGSLMNCKNIYFVPFGQDDSVKKPNSMIANTELIVPAMLAAREGKQMQPILL